MAAMRAALLTLCALVPACSQQLDLIVTGARIVDGSGDPWFFSDLGVRGDTIAVLGNLSTASAARRIDGRGLVVAPGFIDIHTHSRRGIFEHPAAENYIRQGVTTIFEGPDGSSPLPIKPFLDRVAAAHPAPNFGTFAGQGSIRQAVMGLVNRPATPQELEKMRQITRQAMLDSVRETIRIGEEGHLPTQITHHKIIGKENWGKSADTLRLVEEARARGVDVTIDQYPYTASSTGTASLIPQNFQEGGQKALVERLNTVETRARIKAGIIERIKFDRGGGDPANVVMASCAWNHSLDGKSLAQITKDRGREVNFENAAETLMEIQKSGGCQAVFHAISEEDVQRIMKYPFTMIASDGEIPTFGQGAPHPRSYGTNVRVLGRYVRELHTITLEDAVHKMSGLPAQRLKLYDRGLIRPGMKADLAIFDPATVADTATFEKPHSYAAGVKYVIVNGQIVIDNGKLTDARPGRILYGPAKR